eukprot:5134048-Pyramimonas_sp.AAC.1
MASSRSSRLFIGSRCPTSKWLAYCNVSFTLRVDWHTDVLLVALLWAIAVNPFVKAMQVLLRPHSRSAVG